MVKLLKIIFLRYNLYIAICAVAITAWFSLVFQVEYPTEIYVFNGISTFLLYNWMRSLSSYKALLKKSNRIYLICFLIAIPILLWIFFHFSFKLQLLYGLTMLLTLSYKVNLFRKKNLRSMVFLKFPTIALVWTIMGCAYGITQFGCQIPISQFIFVIIMQFFLCLSLTIPYDVFSLHEDCDIVTLPKRVGVDKSLLFSNVFVVCYFVLAFLTDESIQFVSAANIVAIFAIVIIYFSGNFRNKVTQILMIDGILIVQYLVFYLMLNSK